MQVSNGEANHGMQPLAPRAGEILGVGAGAFDWKG